jgi:hypothetical protein
MRDRVRLRSAFLRDSGIERFDLSSAKMVHPWMGKVKRANLWKYDEYMIADSSLLIGIPFLPGIVSE